MQEAKHEVGPLKGESIIGVYSYGVTDGKGIEVAKNSILKFKEKDYVEACRDLDGKIKLLGEADYGVENGEWINKDGKFIFEVEKEEGKWVTLNNGQHIFIREGETLQDAIGRMGEEKKPKINPSAKQIKTGQSITLNYYRNTEKSPDMGSRFGQNIEPTGRYIGYDEMQGKYEIPGFEYGKVTFDNPLVMEYKTTSEGGWKTDLSEKYGGETGKELTAAIKEDGYDAIITVDGDHYSEIVDLKNPNEKEKVATTGNSEGSYEPSYNERKKPKNKIYKDEFEGHNGRWITLEGGQKVFIREGETLQDATNRLKPVKIPTKFKGIKIENKVNRKIESGLSDEDIAKIPERLDKLPREHVKYVKAIEIRDYDYFSNQEGAEAGGRYIRDIDEWQGIPEGTIQLNQGYREAIEAGYLEHEVGHAVYDKTDDGGKWFNFFNKNKEIMPTLTAKRNSEEGFAYSYQNYYTDKPLNPKIKNFFDENVNVKKEK